MLWTSEDGPTHMARIRLVSAYAPSGPLEVHMALIVRRPEGNRQLTQGVSRPHESQSSPAKRSTFLAVVSMA